MIRIIVFCLLLAGVAEAAEVPVLLYHRIAASKNDSMTITKATLVSHFDYLKKNGYQVMALSKIEALLADKKPLPAKTVAICADDGHISNQTELVPLARKYGFPVTLFIYPSAISNASYAMRWEGLRKLAADPLVEIGGHTFYHPNFKIEKKKLGSSAYQKLLETQLGKSKNRLEKELGVVVTSLAWPFGINDPELIAAAKQRGYRSTYTIEARPAKNGDNLLQLPRFLLTEADRGARFEAIVARAR